MKFLLVLAVLGSAVTTLPAAIEFVGTAEEKGLLSFNLRIANVTAGPHGEQIVHATAKAGEKEVALNLVLSASWKKTGPIPGYGDVGPLYFGQVRLQGAGADRDAFSQAVAAALRQKQKRPGFAEAAFTAVALGRRPSPAADGVLQLRMMHGAMPSDTYAVLFCFIDFENGSVRLVEENRRYRRAIATLLSGAK